MSGRCASSEQVHDLPDQGRVRLGGVLDTIAGHLPAGRGQVQQVFRHANSTGPGRPFSRRRNGLLGQGDHLARLLRLPRPLHDRLEGPDQVHLLEGLASPDLPPHLADDCDHGRRIGLGGMQADRQVGGPGRAPGEHQGRPAGQLGDRLGHERRRALVTRRDDSDLVCGQAVQKSEKTLARDGEGDLHAGPSQTPRPGHRRP